VTAAADARLVQLELTEPAPAEVPVGRDVAVRIRASCPAQVDRSGLSVHVIAPDGARSTHALATFDGTSNETGDIALKAPFRIGAFTWRMVLPAHEAGGAAHAECELAVPIRTVPHATSLAVWAVPSPVVAGERFSVKAGAKSSGGCDLSGQRIEVRNADGLVVASGALADAPWPGTSALYWGELDIQAPAEPGLARFSVRFEPGEIEWPHDGASTEFSVAVVAPPEHRLTVNVIAKDTAAPVEDAHIRLGAYQAVTGQSGLAELKMPKGSYELQVWKVGYEAPASQVEIRDDVSVQVELLAVPEEDPDARWKM
jgi:hypothetical protein